MKSKNKMDMTIELITKEQHSILKSMFEKFPALTLKGRSHHRYIDRSKFTAEDEEADKVVTEILNKSVKGFVDFLNFRINSNNEIEIRLKYINRWDGGYPFVGVGYILLDELLNGFNEQESR